MPKLSEQSELSPLLSFHKRPHSCANDQVHLHDKHRVSVGWPDTEHG